MLAPFKFEHDGVEFLLSPLDLQGLYLMQSDLSKLGEPSWETTERLARRHIVGWSGLDKPYSRQALAEVLAGEADFGWMFRLRHIMAELYRRALPTETERKN